MNLSGKIYLTTIYRLKRTGCRVRSVELARHLGVARSSVCRALAAFKEEGYLTVEKGGILSLTDKGLKETTALIRRQDTIADFLYLTLNIDPKDLLNDVIGMEDHLSPAVYKGMKDYVKKVKKEH